MHGWTVIAFNPRVPDRLLFLDVDLVFERRDAEAIAARSNRDRSACDPEWLAVPVVKQ